MSQAALVILKDNVFPTLMFCFFFLISVLYEINFSSDVCLQSLKEQMLKHLGPDA